MICGGALERAGGALEYAELVQEHGHTGLAPDASVGITSFVFLACIVVGSSGILFNYDLGILARRPGRAAGAVGDSSCAAGRPGAHLDLQVLDAVLGVRGGALLDLLASCGGALLDLPGSAAEVLS